ncbi:MAG: ribulose-phosphate 3-epimerase [Neisseriaceae bacterium]
MYKIAPSLLSADFARLGQEVQEVVKAGADWIHFDVMDNHYVPNLTVGPLVCEAIKPYAKSTPIDVHLMVEPVDPLINAFQEAGADCISFHPEASRHVHRSISLIKEGGQQAGLALNPATPITILSEVLLDKLDYLLVMSVNPGFAGQDFIPVTLQKIRQLRKLCEEYEKISTRHIAIQVDGGIKASNIQMIAESGAEIFVAGSAIFKAIDRKKAIRALRDPLEKVLKQCN